MDCMRRRLLIGQLIEQHQLLRNCGDDDDDDDGFTSCCFDVFNLNKSTIGQKIVLFFKKKNLNTAIFDSCFRQKSEQKFPAKKLQDRDQVKKEKPRDHPTQPSIPPATTHNNNNHHHHRHRQTKRACFLRLKNISCKDLIREMCRTLRSEELVQILLCLQSTGNDFRSGGRRFASSSPSPSSLSSPSSCLSSSPSPSSSSSSSSSSCKSQCIVIPKNTFSRLRHSGADAAMVSWFVWRDGEDEERGDEKSRRMRRLPMCAEMGDGVCINPCHWTRLYGDHLPNSDGIQITTRNWLDPWCQTVQRSFCNLNSVKSQISQSWTRINFDRQRITSTDSNCTCQKQTEDQHHHHNHHHQHGEIVLEKSGNDVILHNLSDVPVFVRSPTLEKSSRSSVVRLEPLTSASIYNACLVDNILNSMTDAHHQQQQQKQQQQNHVIAKSLIDSVLISFGKGWGERYRRSSILSCPLWMEVLFNRS